VPAQPRSEGKAGLQRGDRAELPVVQYVPGYSLGMEGRKAEQARECEAVLQMEVRQSSFEREPRAVLRVVVIAVCGQKVRRIVDRARGTVGGEKVYRPR